MNELKYENLDPDCDQDVADVAKIHCETPREWMADHAYSAESVNRAIRNLRDPEQRNYVVLARNPQGEIVGLHWVQLEVKSEARLGNVCSLWVLPKYRQQGIATRLKELAESWLRSNGATEVRTMVYIGNERMIGLNKKLGYEVVRVGMSKSLS